MITAKDIRAKNQELKNKIEELKKSYIKNANLIDLKYREHVELNKEADNIDREINRDENKGYDIPKELFKKRNDLLKQADISLKESQKANELMHSLNKDMGVEENTLKTWYCPVTKKDIYSAQKEIKEIKTKIEKTESVLSKEQQKEFATHSTELMDLESQHNKLMAEVALGEDKQEEADKLEVKINKLIKLSEQERRNRHKQDGIIQQITTTLEELKNIKHNLDEDYKEIKRHFCITQAEAKTKEYILTFEKLANLKSELDFYCNKAGIKTNNQDIVFPEFNLASFSGTNFSKLVHQDPSIDKEIEDIILS